MSRTILEGDGPPREIVHGDDDAEVGAPKKAAKSTKKAKSTKSEAEE